MPDPKQLPYLLRLLDDESPTVRNTILEELAAYGATLGEELADLGLTLSSEEANLLQAFRDERNQKWLKEIWPVWFRLGDEKEKLETALSMLSDYLGNRLRQGRLTLLLDELAAEYRAEHRSCDVRDLSRFLFSSRKLEGAREDYYNPRNSNLVYVIEHGKGIPISLVSIFILVGHRLGLAIEGCNFPGHFLALTFEQEKPLVIDCFNAGILVDDLLLARYLDPVSVTVHDLTHLECDTLTLVGRVLRNLMNAYRSQGKPEGERLMKELLDMSSGESLN
ncbi:MAG: transglutaminase family protein [Bacteroidetes bacterium]|nr:transglutaminase family protein [Bacteroidota bacterium]